MVLLNCRVSYRSVFSICPSAKCINCFMSSHYAFKIVLKYNISEFILKCHVFAKILNYNIERFVRMFWSVVIAIVLLQSSISCYDMRSRQ